MSAASEVGFVTGPVRIVVPATSANLGPGFDCLGLALDLHDTLTGEVVGSGLEIAIAGEGAATLPRSERHLVVRSMRAGFEALGVQPPGLRLEVLNRIPQSRGLGSSSAAIVGGLALARALVVDGARLLPDAELLRIANRLEGHPDNVAPALFGGFVVSGTDDREVWAVLAPVAAGIRTVAFIPSTPVSTEEARGLLPAQVPHKVAAANTGRAALLVAAMGGATGAGLTLAQALARGTEDFLHQEFRASAMPESFALVGQLRAVGVAAFISGAGPTVLALTDADGIAGLLACCPPGWATHSGTVDLAGVRELAL